MKKIEQKVIHFISQHKLIKQNDRVLIALSGGPDSVFALYFFNKYRNKYKIELTAVHFNHQLRGEESETDQMFCEQLCSKLNIPLYSFLLDVKNYSKENKLSIEEAARILRYQNLEETANKIKCNKIVTAHNLTDNTETVLINFFSGTGLSGFAGIPIKRDKIIRPFLCLTKDEILDYLNYYKIDYRIDSSNLTNDFKRNIIRNEILPIIRQKINPQADSAIFRSTKVLENISELIESHIKELINKYARIREGAIFIKSTVIKKVNDGILGEIIKQLLKENYKHHFDYNDFTKLKSLFEKQPGKIINLSSTLKAIKERNGIKIFTSPKEEENPIFYLRIGERIKVDGKTIGIDLVKNQKPKLRFYKSNKTKNVEYISADKFKLDEIFILRKWKSGDKFIPLGMKNPKKVSDFLTDIKIKSSEKKDIFVLTNKDKIVWVIGLRIDERFKIISSKKMSKGQLIEDSQKTKRILKLWVRDD